MKRTWIALILMLSVLFCLPACTPAGENSQVFEKLNGFVQPNAYTIKICVTSPNGNKVTENYDVTVAGGQKTVKYRIERINSITVNGDTITVPEDYVTVTDGTVNAADAMGAAYALPKFHFSDAALKNFTVIANYFPTSFRAEVTSTEDFMGVALDATNITVSGVYLVSSFQQVTISYTTENGNQVTVTYLYK